MFFEEEVYVIGDSHCRVFYQLNKYGHLRTKFTVKMVPGATALGLANPNSATDALKQFRNFLQEVDKRKKIIFLLGEVDTGFVIWYRSEKYSIPVEQESERSLNNYIAFIEECMSSGFQRINVLSVPLPTIRDGQDWGEVANKRKEVKASQREKTILTVKYNQKLKQRLTQMGLTYISLDGHLIDPQTGIVREDYLNKDRLDHHLDDVKFAGLIERELRSKNLIKRKLFAKGC